MHHSGRSPQVKSNRYFQMGFNQSVRLMFPSQRFLSILMVVLSLLSFVSAANADTSVALWQGDKKGAVSITFNNGWPSQYNNAFPILQQYGLKGTFYTVCSGADTNALLTLAADGQEIGSQTLTDRNLKNLSDEQRIIELSQSQEFLQNLTGQKVSTLAYPLGGFNATVINATDDYYIAGRTVDPTNLNSSLPSGDLIYKLLAIGPHSKYGEGDPNAIAGLKYWTDRAVLEHKWFIELFHSIGVPDGYDSISTEAFGTHIDYLAANEPNLWVAPVGAVSEYIYERSAASITTISEDNTLIQLELECGLDSRFTTPLTLLTDCPAGWEAGDIYIRQGQMEQMGDVVYKGSSYFTITASAGANGALEPSGDITKVWDSEQMFTAVPDPGYQVDQWFVDGISVLADCSTYTLTQIRIDHTVSVTFKPYLAAVTLWQGDKKGALSMTFDDGLPSQFDNAFPLLQQHDMKATFFIIAGNYNANRVLTLAEDGQEIGSHSMSHLSLKTLSPVQQEYELAESQSILEDLTGQDVATFAYPYGSYDPNILGLTEDYYIAARSANSNALNSSLPWSTFYKLNVVGPHDRGSGDINAIACLQYFADKAVAEKKWAIEMFHSIGVTGGTDTVSSEAFDTHLDYLSANEPNIWVAPMGEVSEYIYERDAAAVTTLVSDSNMIQLDLQCGLDSRFDTPLTLLSICPYGWESRDIYVKQGQTEQLVEIIFRDGIPYMMYNAILTPVPSNFHRHRLL